VTKAISRKKSKPGVTGEFVRVLTEDGMELQGFYVGRSQKLEVRMQRSESPNPELGPRSLTADPFCLVHVHGWDGNFYENRFIDHAAEVCARQGIGFVTGNNRGHDYIADILRDKRSQKPDATDPLVSSLTFGEGGIPSPLGGEGWGEE